MYYLHRYSLLYPPEEEKSSLERALLMMSILSMVFKQRYQDFVLEYLPIREMLGFFKIDLDALNQNGCPATPAHNP